jgi:hypothetical protein
MAATLQPLEALQRANRVRIARAELKAQIADGRRSAAEVILTCPPEAAGMPIAHLLTSQRGWGDTRARSFLIRAYLPWDKSIGSLTDRQRQAVASQLASTVAPLEPVQVPMPPAGPPSRGAGQAEHARIEAS